VSIKLTIKIPAKIAKQLKCQNDKKPSFFWDDDLSSARVTFALQKQGLSGKLRP